MPATSTTYRGYTVIESPDSPGQPKAQLTGDGGDLIHQAVLKLARVSPTNSDPGTIVDANGVTVAQIVTVASAVNRVQFTAAATGGMAAIGVAGSDTDAGLLISAKGCGNIDIPIDSDAYDGAPDTLYDDPSYARNSVIVGFQNAVKGKPQFAFCVGAYNNILADENVFIFGSGRRTLSADPTLEGYYYGAYPATISPFYCGDDGIVAGYGAMCGGHHTRSIGDGAVAWGASASAVASAASCLGPGYSDIPSQFSSGMLHDTLMDGKAVRWGVHNLWAKTTNATPTALRAIGNSSADTFVPYKLWRSGVLSAIVRVTAAVDGGTDVGYWEYRLLYRKTIAGATSVLAGPTLSTSSGTNSGSVPAGWSVAITADDTNDTLEVTATGAAATTIRWYATVDYRCLESVQ